MTLISTARFCRVLWLGRPICTFHLCVRIQKPQTLEILLCVTVFEHSVPIRRSQN